MSKTYDLIVIGAGLNGMTTAAYVARKGRRVLVVEKDQAVGGLQRMREFKPSFRVPGLLHDTSGLRPWVISDLELTKHGLKLRSDDVPVFTPTKRGRGLLVFKDATRSYEDLEAMQAGDGDAYKKYRAFFDRASPFLRKVFDEFPPELGAMSFPGLWDLLKKAVSLRMLGSDDMMEILRIGPMCVADWLAEWFKSDEIKAHLSGPAIAHSYTGPWSPGTNANLLLAEALRFKPVEGGAAQVAIALEKAVKAAGAEVRVGTEVKEILIEEGKAVGVILASGETLRASKIAASCDPKTLFLGLVPPATLTHRFEHDIVNYRSRGTAAKVHLALSELPAWSSRPGLKAEYVRTGEHVDELEKAFDAVKYREISKRPVLDIYIPTLEDPTLAPNGKHVMSVIVNFAPYKCDMGHGDDARALIYERTMAVLTELAPNIAKAVEGYEVLTAKDIEQQYGVAEGHMLHGEHAADQLLIRPTPAASRYETPIENLFLVGGGTHPGGGVSGAPGGLAARAILGR